MQRCAVYTRKSTEEGLEQDFNSLDAQREACEAYIQSQRHEGWRVVKAHFDDGGSSGGTMNRPALMRLLESVKRHEIDVVVVYKVDRLTRSLSDFAKIVELFDAHGVSFVSVTQQFNTTSSMGRLTLNVLLSFAQFEREVTAERIRDKIAASKRKGMWMGGQTPLGYDVKDRKLVANKSEAAIVRKLFQLYLYLGSVRRLKEEADKLELVTKRRQQNGHQTGGKPFTRGNLYKLLSNPLYIGQIPHKGETYAGLHEGIVPTQIWEAAQKLRVRNSVERQTTSNAKSLSLLSGLVFDEEGRRLGPSHTKKNGRRYRYYVSINLGNRLSRRTGWRLAADNFEHLIICHLIGILSDHRQLSDQQLSQSDQDLSAFWSLKDEAKKLIGELTSNDFGRKRVAIEAVLKRVDLSPTSIAFSLNRSSLLDTKPINGQEKALTISFPMTLRRRGVEQKLVIEAGHRPAGQRDPKLCRLVAQAHVWFDQLVKGKFSTVRAIARENKLPECDVSRTLRFAFLAPDIVTAIVEGRQPVDLTAETFRRLSTLPTSWDAQRKLLGFSA